MRDCTVALAQVCRVSGRSYHVLRSIVLKPTPLPFVKAAPGPRGGNSERLYELRPLLLRLRQKEWFTTSMENELCRIDLAARMNEVN